MALQPLFLPISYFSYLSFITKTDEFLIAD